MGGRGSGGAGGGGARGGGGGGAANKKSEEKLKERPKTPEEIRSSPTYNPGDAGASMSHGNYTYHASFTNETTGERIMLRGYISKPGLWEDAVAKGATPAQLKRMKAAMKNAPKKSAFLRR